MLRLLQYELKPYMFLEELENDIELDDLIELEREFAPSYGTKRSLAFEEEDLEDGFDVITKDEYIAWVKRSLNRLYSADLVVDSSKSTSYRRFVRQFQSDHVLPTTGEVNAATQNAIIKANERVRDYLLWVQRALESDSIFTDPPRTRPDSKGSFKSSGLRQGIRIFQRRQGLVEDGFIGAKSETLLIKICRCLPSGHIAPKMPVKPTSRIIPFTAKQVTLLVWGLTGRQPEKVSAGRLAWEFARFIELKKLLRKPTLFSLFKHALRVYWKTVFAYFSEEPERQFGALMGGAYAIMDVATAGRTSRSLKSGNTRAQRLVSSGFNKGYREMRNHLRPLASDQDVKRMLRRMVAGTRRSVTLGRVYRALHEVAISKEGGKSLIFLSARKNCRFSYPGFKTSCRV